jgi:nucleotide-binding universal stress UspA family protein
MVGGAEWVSAAQSFEPEEVKTMYDRILLAVDHSQTSDRAVLAARDLATLSGGEVRVLHLREREIATKGVTVMNETAGDADAQVAAAVEMLTQAGVKAQGEVRTTIYGSAAREIVGDAKDFGADVIVMGSRGRGDLAGIILGSTAHKVIHLTDRPVLVVRLHARPERACCCAAKAAVRVIMPPTPARAAETELLLCGHHYRASTCG